MVYSQDGNSLRMQKKHKDVYITFCSKTFSQSLAEIQNYNLILKNSNRKKTVRSTYISFYAS